MASITLRPTSASGTSWSNMGNAYDGNESTLASVSASRFDYSSKTLTLDFDTTVIPSTATINSATLTLRSKAGKNTMSAYVDINGNSEYRVINQKQSTNIANYTADVISYISELSNIVVTPYNTNWSGNTFELYELWIDVDYTASTTSTTYTITASVGTGGSITPSGATTVLEGGSQTYTISADPGYKIKDVKVDGVSQGAITIYTFDNVTSNHTIEAIFAPVISRQVILTPAAVDLTISNYLEESSPFTNAIGKGSNNEGDYAEWSLVTGGAVKTYTCWSFDMSFVPSNATITNVTCSARCSNTNANVTQGGNTTVAMGTTSGTEYVNKQDSSTPAFGTEPTVVTISSTDYTRAELDNFRLKIQAARGLVNTDISYHTKFYGATLTIDYEVEDIPHTIIASANTGGTISPNGSTIIYEGESQVYTISANTGYRIKSVTVDGTDQGVITSYTFSNVTSDHTISAVFEAIPTYTVRFLDWDNSVIDTQTVEEGGSATPPSNPTRVGYTFSGWSGNYTNVTADVDIIAQYTQNTVKNIKIGNSTIDKLYLGTSQIVKVYLGDILLYSDSTGGGSSSKNIFNKATAKLNYKMKNHEIGSEIVYAEDSSYFCSSYIKVNPDTMYILSHDGSISSHSGIVFLNEDKKVLDFSETNPFTTVSGTKYIVFCDRMDYIDIVQIEEGNTATDYEPY